MREKIKFLLKHSPIFIKTSILHLREGYFSFVSSIKEGRQYPNIIKTRQLRKEVRNILIYHISGMSFGGTEKGLQLIANNLTDEYTVYFMYSSKSLSKRQQELMNQKVHLIEFTYSDVESKFPYFIHGMNPHVKDIINQKNIDLFITADAGHSQYPFNTIKDIPIIMINIFGSPTLQKNIVANVFLSETVKKYSEQFTGKRESNEVAFLPVSPPEIDTEKTGEELREKLNIKVADFVFGRIGRDSDSIFDPIGIEAFKKVVKELPNSHYLIMSPPPILVEKVKKEKIPNVHFVEKGGNIWEFYGAIDCLAHFRLDGETSGLNIAEAMYIGKPIISHKSHIWNAHLEYLDNKFSRVAEKDDILQYKSYMEEFINIKKNRPEEWGEMKEEARRVAEEKFSEKKYVETIKKVISSIELK
ncbi:MAG: hypothetical protein JWN37_367 [Candidatus Nomurabacteria bacterium]|nr:hypothetical protein [Candidatus Nomurabacteria bacterium]